MERRSAAGHFLPLFRKCIRRYSPAPCCAPAGLFRARPYRFAAPKKRDEDKNAAGYPSGGAACCLLMARVQRVAETLLSGYSRAAPWGTKLVGEVKKPVCTVYSHPCVSS